MWIFFTVISCVLLTCGHSYTFVQCDQRTGCPAQPENFFPASNLNIYYTTSMVCDNSKEGMRFADYKSNCEKYYICFSGVAKLQQCPPKRIFDYRVGDCNAARHATCYRYNGYTIWAQVFVSCNPPVVTTPPTNNVPPHPCGCSSSRVIPPEVPSSPRPSPCGRT